jgi:hypothetical protein
MELPSGGLFDIGEAGRVVINTAQRVVNPREHLPAWPPDADRPYRHDVL